MRSELRLSGHPRPATESEDVWNDYPFGDSAATSFLSSHDHIIGTWRSGYSRRRALRLPDFGNYSVRVRHASAMVRSG
jgi:hypothetical protein